MVFRIFNDQNEVNTNTDSMEHQETAARARQVQFKEFWWELVCLFFVLSKFIIPPFATNLQAYLCSTMHAGHP